LIKGAQRSIVVLRVPSGKYFEQAYFIVKDGVENKRGTKRDMVKEAAKIAMDAISDCDAEDVLKKKHGLYYFLYFSLGMFVCSLICAALILFVL